MLRHADIWRAIDTLAKVKGLTPSGLARKAGLDPTTFNKSKRTTRDSRLRWPSTESVAKVLAATGASLEEFVSFVEGEDTVAPSRRIPVVDFAKAKRKSLFGPDGRPKGQGWGVAFFPDTGDPDVYAFRREGGGKGQRGAGDAFGGLIVVSPSARVRRGHRAIVRTVDGEVIFGSIARRNAERIVVRPASPKGDPRELPRKDIAWIHRVVWARE